jgi:hypothetical protein
MVGRVINFLISTKFPERDVRAFKKYTSEQGEAMNVASLGQSKCPSILFSFLWERGNPTLFVAVKNQSTRSVAAAAACYYLPPAGTVASL